MIKNAREYQITKAQAAKFERALDGLVVAKGNELAQLERDALKSQLDDLRAQLDEYEALETGRLKVLEVDDLNQLPKALIQARISAGLSQRELAERLGLKEQQVQRYEASEYASASLSRIREVVTALGIHLRQDVVLPTADLSLDALVTGLGSVGFDRDFVQSRLVADADHTATTRTAWRTANVVSRMFGIPPVELFSTPSAVHTQPALYKIAANTSEPRLRAYTVYAHYLASRLLACTSARPGVELPSHPQIFLDNVVSAHGELNFENVLRYVWSLGIPVLPLRDSGAFHGAFWKIAGRPVIVIKQHVFSEARWVIDLLHEYRHAVQTSASDNAEVVETNESPVEQRNDPREREATQWASAVVLGGREQELAEACVAESQREIPLLKAAVERVALRSGVSIGALAYYMAYRLAQEGHDWWGAATNMQRTDEDPWSIARDVLLENTQLQRLDTTDRGLLTRALNPEEIL